MNDKIRYFSNKKQFLALVFGPSLIMSGSNFDYKTAKNVVFVRLLNFNVHKRLSFGKYP
jgi:hypothetical protein